VTSKILELDTKTCDTLLRKIYDDMSNQDMKEAIFQQSRMEERRKLVDRHNQTMELEEKCGVRLGMNKTAFKKPFPSNSVGHQTLNTVSKQLSSDRENNEMRSSPLSSLDGLL
jgi:hypothetical protein